MRVLLVAVVLGMSGAYSKQCCMPNQFECKQAIHGGTIVDKKPAIISDFTLISYDGVNKKISSITNMTLGEKQGAYWVIQLYDEGVMYVADMEAKSCVKSKLESSMEPPCSPPMAKEGDERIVYGGGSHTMEAKIYTWHVEQPGSILDNVLIVVPDGDDCYAMAEENLGSANNSPLVETTGFVDITKGIKSPSIFTPPSYCNQVPMSSYKPKRRRGFLGLYL